MPKWLFVLFILALALGQAQGYASARSLGQAPSASVSLTAPVPATALVGDEITFDLVFSVANQAPGMSGVDIYVSYNPAVVAPPASPSLAAEALPGFFGASNVSINEVLPAAQCPGATLPCVHLVLAGSPQTTKTDVAARFRFSGIAQGSACFSILQSNLVNADGFAITHTVGAQQCANFQYEVDVHGSALRQGVPANPNVGGGTLACVTVSATGVVETPAAQKTSSTGAFSFLDIPLDTYTFRASYSGYLPAQKSGVVVNGSVDLINLPAVTLRGGDVNGDNFINILDIGLIVSKFGQSGVAVKSASVDCSAADEAADINDDGLVNISDLAIVAGNWGLVGPTVWP
jgi:hypothetical protein